MFQFDILSLIPQSLKRQGIDITVTFVAEQAKKFLSEEVSNKIKKLRSDAAFQTAFEEGLQRAVTRFADEYGVEDEDLVAALLADKTLFQNEAVQHALLAILKKPGIYLADERELLAQSFDSVLPQRRNRERVNRAVIAFLKHLAEEVWNLPELRPAYELQFQRMTAESIREQVDLQRAQLQASTALGADIREALLQLTDVIAEQKLLPDGDSLALPAPPKVHHNLPQADYTRFVGRKAELKQIRQLLLPQTRHFVVTIDGIGGIGKSALALEVAHSYLRHTDKLPGTERFEAIIWTSAKQTVLTGEGIAVRAQSLRTLDDIYSTIAITIGREDITHVRPQEQDELVRQGLAAQRTLLIVDNLETVDDERVLTFIREVPAPTKVIVTTRHRLDVAYPVRLIGMSEADALTLIIDETKKKGVTLTDDEARRLYQRTGGVPLAIVWSVAQMGFGYGIEAVLTRLGQPTNDIAEFCFEGAVQRLKSRPTYKLLLALSLFATDASRDALGYVADLPELDRDEGLVELEKLSLVNKRGTRFEFLPLTKGFVIAQLKEKPAVENGLQLAFIHYFVEMCKKYGGEQWRLYHNLDEDVQNMQLALEWAYQLQMWSEVRDFVNNLVEFFGRRGLWNEIVQYSEIAIEVGKNINDKHLIMKHKMFGLGWIKASRFREFEEAMSSLQEAEKLALELGDERTYAATLYDESYIFYVWGDYDRAEMLLQNSLTIWRKLGDQRWEIRTISSLGDNQFMRGNIDEAFVYYTKCLNMSQAIGDTDQMAENLRGLSKIQWLRGNFEEAYASAKDALEMLQQLNMVNSIAGTNFLLAKINFSLGRVDEAKQQAEKSHEIFSKLKSYRLQEIVELLEAINKSPNDPSVYLAKQGVKGYAPEPLKNSDTPNPDRG